VSSTIDERIARAERRVRWIIILLVALNVVQAVLLTVIAL
jgi:uncharacterized Rmd1/YagE family protein